jgi:hypothetical protein
LLFVLKTFGAAKRVLVKSTSFSLSADAHLVDRSF